LNHRHRIGQAARARPGISFITSMVAPAQAAAHRACGGGVTKLSGRPLISGRMPPIVVGVANGAPGIGRKEMNHGSVTGVVWGCVD